MADARVKRHGSPPPRGSRRFVRRVLLAVAGLVLLVVFAVGIALLLVTSAPADYAPEPLTAQEQQETEFRAEKKGEEFYNQTHRLAPFTISFEEELINRLLLLDDANDFLARHWPTVTQRVRQPQVAFHPGQVRLLARVPLDEAAPVVAVALAPSLDEYGNVVIELKSVHAGRLPVPETLLHDRLREFAEALPTTVAGIDPENQELLEIVRDRLGELLATGRTRLPGRFRAVEDKSATITGLRILSGRIELDLDPAPLPD